MTPLRVHDARPRRGGGAYALQERHIPGGRAGVVAVQHDFTVRVRADYGYPLDFFAPQWQHTVIFEQYHRAPRGVQRQRGVRVTVRHFVGYRVVLAVAVKHAELEARGHDADGGPANIAFFYEPLSQRY
jgi:hypothetical protein